MPAVVRRLRGIIFFLDTCKGDSLSLELGVSRAIVLPMHRANCFRVRHSIS